MSGTWENLGFSDKEKVFVVYFSLDRNNTVKLKLVKHPSQGIEGAFYNMENLIEMEIPYTVMRWLPDYLLRLQEYLEIEKEK